MSLYRARTLLMAGVLEAASAGCAHIPPEQTQLDELNRTIETLRAQNGAYKRQVEELENRVFILSDRLDSKTVNAEKVATPELPKITLHPVQKAPVAGEPAESNESNDSNGPQVEYTGDAAKVTAKRPVLRLYGDEIPIFANTRETEPPPRPVAVASEGVREPRPSPLPRPVAVASGPEDAYRRAQEMLKAGKHPEAMAAFRDFVRQHASHDLADNAQYWLAEVHYHQKDYPSAVREFRRVVEKYPQGNKVPDALLKVGFCYLAIGSTDAARQTLEQLVRSYPRHESTSIASAKLTEMAAAARPAESQPSKTDSRSTRPVQEVP